MNRSITRRDFLHGTSMAVVAAMACALPDSAGRRAPTPASSNYPPALTGLRGSQPGSFEVAHRLAREGRRDWGRIDEVGGRTYDLVVVGGGVSGLAAAYFYRRRNPRASILILDNHDDFGGHARRNEFRSGGRRLIGYGGSQSLESPGEYSGVAQQLLRELAVETSRFYTAYDRDYYREHGLGIGVFFDRASYGVDRLVPMALANVTGDRFAPSPISREEAVAQMPISEVTKRDLRRLFSVDASHFSDPAVLEDLSFLQKISYEDFLTQYLGIDNPELWKLLHSITAGNMALGVDALVASDVMAYGGLPGLPPDLLRNLIEGEYGADEEPYIFHFPDGNASIARLLVRSLIPQSAPGKTMEDVVTARFDYGQFDEPDSQVRLRLDSTVVRAEHEGAPSSAKRVLLTYVRDGQATRVRGKACVLACYNMMIPYLCPELPAEQRKALASLVKAPLVYTSVALRNWQPWKRAGLAIAFCPGSSHQTATLDFPVSLGDVRFSANPEEPTVAHLERAPIQPDLGLTPRQQYRAGRQILLSEHFDQIERSIRTQLSGMLGAFGFDPALDIEAITVNRWPHGYAYNYNPLFDPEYAEGDAPHERGRRPFGRIAIANSDSGARAYIDCAIDQAFRAVSELSADPIAVDG